MLTDLFGDFDFDDLNLNEVRQNISQFYVADNHSDAWFFSVDKGYSEREASYNRAVYLYYHGTYELAMKEFLELLDSFKHNRVNRVVIIDSLLRCALKVSDFPVPDILRYMSQYEKMITGYGDHLQFLDLSKTILARIDSDWASHEFLDTVCLLCATVDLPEHWMAFGEKPSLRVGPNFTIAYLTRAIILSEKHLRSARGFAVRALQQKLHGLNIKLRELNLSSFEYNEAKLRMGWDLTVDESTKCEEETRPAHECKSTSSIFENPLHRRAIIESFRKKFIWMFYCK